MSYIVIYIYICAKGSKENYTGQIKEEMKNNSLPEIIMVM
jgi:hypothetical protein